MSIERTVPNSSVYDVVTFDINTDGNPVDPGCQVLWISVSKDVNRIPTAKVEIIDGDSALETFPISESDTFLPGKEIQIKIGYDSKNTQVFKGIITKQSIRVRSNGDAVLQVEARDAAVKMTIGRHSNYYEKQKDSQVMETLIGNYAGLSSEVESTQLQHKELVQHHVSDWDFLLSRADVNGLLVIVDDGKVQVKKPDASVKGKLTLSFGGTINEFEAELESRYQWAAVKANSWDYAAQQLFEAQSTSSSFAEPGNITGKKLSDTIGLKEFEMHHGGHRTTEELDAWTKAAMLKSRLSKICGTGKIVEGFDIRPGETVELAGLGDRFNGTAYVTGVRHEITEGSWYTYVQFGLSPDWYAKREDIIDFPAAGLVPAIYDLQVGKVVKLEEDPDGDDRIQVKLPIIDANASGTWCRYARLDAGNERGTFWLPEIDDEVVVGFINGDPRDAIVLGALHSSNKPAPIKAKDTNHQKGIFTREKMRLLFDDETKTITIDTPAKNSIVIDEKTKSITITDQNKNKITMDDKGITIDSPKDINIKAGANINIEAKANLNIKATAIKEEAKAALEMKGATAKMEASGIAEVKGSLVKIN